MNTKFLIHMEAFYVQLCDTTLLNYFCNFFLMLTVPIWSVSSTIKHFAKIQQSIMVIFHTLISSFGFANFKLTKTAYRFLGCNHLAPFPPSLVFPQLFSSIPWYSFFHTSYSLWSCCLLGAAVMNLCLW